MSGFISRTNKKKISQKAVYRLIMILALCIFVLANLCTGKLARFFGLTMDFTGERLYSLSDATKKSLADLESETTIFVLSEESEYSPMLKEILRRYSLLSPMIHVKFVDPHLDPVFLDWYIREGFLLKESDLLIEGSKGRRHIPAIDIFRQFNSGRASGLFLEEKLTNAVLQVNKDISFSVSFTLGHGENPAALKEALSGSGFSAKDLVLLSGEIPVADIVIIAGPERDFLPEEISVLHNYLENGGRLLVFMGPGASGYQELENLLALWDLSLLPGVVFETVAHAYGNPASLIPLYGVHETNLSFAQRQYYLVMPGASAVESLAPEGTPEETGGIVITRLLLSTRDSYIKRDNSSSRSSGDPAGPFALAGAAEKQNGSGGTVVLFGSSMIYADDIIDVPAYANREYLTRITLWLAGGQEYDLVSIPSKSLTPPKINSGFGLVVAALLIFAVILPLMVLVTGGVTLIKRRSK